ncbi:cadherin-89D isoform X2 [Plutella xylostella]|uniref:cadherin-89D isoform X2 n=1 Tax=Plutella xylostella TaxID=51655 RepID=UPI00203306FF|nr:cadherin-89D isoform X2 [Plutella xylostella]
MKQLVTKMWTKYTFVLVCSALYLHTATCCNFYPVGEYLRFVRIPEDLKVGEEVLRVEVHPRKNLSLQPVDKEEDAHLFTYRDVNRTHVSVVLAQSLEELVDSDNPQNVVKFRLGCDFDTGDDLISAYLSVTVYVEDINDHAPQFTGAPYRLTVDELTPTGLTIFKSIHAFDRDKPNTPNSDVQYSISSGDQLGHFALESSHRPALVLKRSLDYDAGDREFKLVVTASDRGTPSRSSNATVLVSVQDSDDLPPKFTLDVYRTQIPEFYPLLGKRIHKELAFEEPIKALDQDMGVGAPVRYELISGNDRRLFYLNPINGTLFLEKEIDLDSETSLPGNTFMLQIQAAQVDNPLKTAQARVEIELLDLNDNLPEFEVDFYNISIVENLPNGFSVLQVMATDRDQGDNGEFMYQLNDPEGAFAIDPRTGWLTVKNQTVLDREQHANLRMKVYAKEKNPSVVGTFLDKQRLSKWRRNPTTLRGQPTKEKTTYVFPDRIGAKSENVEYFEDIHQLMSFVTVEVTLLDANDNNPTFTPSNLYEFSIKSNANVGMFIGKVKAVDPDLGRNGIVFYDLQRTSNLTITSPFQVDAKTGVITLAETPIVEGRHALFIEASDQPANPSERRYSLAVVTIDVVRPNKGSRPEKPDFLGAPYEFWVGSNVGIGTSVGQIKVNDAMVKHEVVYDLLHGYEEGVPFAVEEKSGVITVIDELSKYNRPMFDFEAMAVQENTNVTIVTNATVHVVDVQDERGVLLKGAHSPLEFTVKENIGGATIGQIFYVNVSSLPPNATGNIQFIIANQQDVTDDIAIGQDGTIFAQKPLDREKRDTYRMTVIAEFNKGLISGAGIYQIVIHVEDDNDNPPVFDSPSYEGSIIENSKKGTLVKMSGKVRAKDADLGQNALFMYTLFGEGHEQFSVDENTGSVMFIGYKLDREEKSLYLLKIVARDKGGLSSETKLTITIVDENDNSPKYSQITIPVEENITLLEVNDKATIKIYREKINEKTGMVSKIEAKPKNKFSVMADTYGPLFSVPENVAVGSTILKLDALDMDSSINGQVRYEFMSEVFMPPHAMSAEAMNVKRYFVINERHGYIIVARSLPPESEFRLNVSALDGGGLSDNLSVRIFVKDVNDHFPMFKKSWYTFNVEEALYSRKVLGKIDATDADFGQNANLTYYIQPDTKELPFEISPQSGVFSVNGELDREREEKYTLTVVAKDNGPDKKLSSSVTVEVQVLDVNDNAPKFFAYDELQQWKHPEANEHQNHNFESVMMMPIYRSKIEENSPIGTTVGRVYANDSDFIGNGNGLILYSLPQRRNHMNLFTIDSKEGIITTVGKLDYETQSIHNITVVASDLGSPSLSSTAVVILSVTDLPDEVEVKDKPVFISRYYELEIEENVHTPVELVTLNLTEYYENFKMKYYILNENDPAVKKMFVIDPRNGTLYLVKSPDRETKATYEIVVRAERQKISRELPHMIYPVSDDVLEGMTKFDVKVIVRIKDVNDNAPKFTSGGRPMVTAIPTTAAFGYQVIQLHATDSDLGINADIRYQIINDQSQRFAIDPISGQVRAVASFARDAGRVFGFDVKATDKKGADDGKSAIANVFVYVLDDNNQLVLVLGGKPMDVEIHMENITKSLADITGYDIRVRKLEANSKAAMEGLATDMYIYAVDPMSNAIIDMEVLQKSLLKREVDLRHELNGFKILEVGDTTMAQARSSKMLSTMEISIVALGCIVFIGACTTAICILCVRRSRRNTNKPYSKHRLNTFSTEHLAKYGGLFPSGGNQCQELNQSYSEADSYIDVINTVAKKICPHGNTVEEFGKAHQKCVKNTFPGDGHASDPCSKKHENLCIKYNQVQRPLQKRRGQDTSITSVNSSGQDSGIAERCPCGHSNAHTSEDSSGCSYEDSLKSNNNHQIEIRTTTKPYHQSVENIADHRFHRRASFSHQPFDHRRFNFGRQSFSENIQKHFPPFERIGSGPRMTRQISTPNVSVLSTQPYFLGNKKAFRRKEALNEPMIDYDQSDGDDHFDVRINRRASTKHKRGKLMELGGQAAVFVATPAAAELMRRQGSERFMFARPL